MKYYMLKPDAPSHWSSPNGHGLEHGVIYSADHVVDNGYGSSVGMHANAHHVFIEISEEAVRTHIGLPVGILMKIKPRGICPMSDINFADGMNVYIDKEIKCNNILNPVGNQYYGYHSQGFNWDPRWFDLIINRSHKNLPNIDTPKPETSLITDIQVGDLIYIRDDLKSYNDGSPIMYIKSMHDDNYGHPFVIESIDHKSHYIAFRVIGGKYGYSNDMIEKRIRPSEVPHTNFYWLSQIKDKTIFQNAILALPKERALSMATSISNAIVSLTWQKSSSPNYWENLYRHYTEQEFAESMGIAHEIVHPVMSSSLEGDPPPYVDRKIDGYAATMAFPTSHSLHSLSSMHNVFIGTSASMGWHGSTGLPPPKSPDPVKEDTMLNDYSEFSELTNPESTINVTPKLTKPIL